MKIIGIASLFFAITFCSVSASQPSPELKSAARDLLTATEAAEKVMKINKQFIQRWKGRRLKADEDKQVKSEEEELVLITNQVEATLDNASQRFITIKQQSKISFPEGISIFDAARMVASGNVSNSGGSESSSRERCGLASLSAEVLRQGKDAGRAGYVLYTVQVRASLDGPARQSSRVDLMTRGSDDLSAAIRGNSSITVKTGESSASAKFSISAKPNQRVEIQGRYSDLDRSTTESTSFFAE